MKNFQSLPDDLPVPIDDGKADHLAGQNLTAHEVTVVNSHGKPFRVPTDFGRKSVLFIFPKAGSPLEPDSGEGWDQIPGARGCTPQSCGYRDLSSEFARQGIKIYGMSIQPPEVLHEIETRLHLNYPLLSDADHLFAGALKLPAFGYGDQMLLKRMALYIEAGVIQRVFYPVFPPDQNARVVLDYLKGRAG